MTLFDEEGQRIRGLENKAAAELALARIQVAGGDQMEGGPASHTEWPVAKVCSDYIQYYERGVVSGSISKGHRDNTAAFLNDLCRFAGALPVKELKKGHINNWVEEHATWRSPATQRGVLSIVSAAFNRAEQMYDVPGLKKPTSQPRLQSFSAEDEQSLYKACEPRFREFLFAAIRTGLRPYCELARITANDFEETPRGMMWRVYSSKTKKTRKIPVQKAVAPVSSSSLDLLRRGPRSRTFSPFQVVQFVGSITPLLGGSLARPRRAAALQSRPHQRGRAGTLHMSAGFDLEEHFAKSFGVFHGDGDIPVRVRFLPPVVRYVEESHWHASQHLTLQKDGSLLADFRLGNTEELKRWLLSFGRHALVEPPPPCAKKCSKN